MEQMDAPTVAADLGKYLTEALLALPGVDSVRGAGLLLAAELNEDGLQGRTGGDIAKLCADAGVLVNGVSKTALRLAPPITTTNNEIDEAVRMIASVLHAGAGN